MKIIIQIVAVIIVSAVLILGVGHIINDIIFTINQWAAENPVFAAELVSDFSSGLISVGLGIFIFIIVYVLTRPSSSI